MDYRRQFEKTARKEGEDPSIFTIAFETLAVKAFGDMGHTTRLRLICDRFIAGHDSWTVCRRRLPSGILLTAAECRRATLTPRPGGSVN